MIKLIRILCVAFAICFVGTYAYGLAYEPSDEEELIKNLESNYNINIIIPDDVEYVRYRECLLVLEHGLSRFSDGVIKEITQYYSDKGIETNIIVNKTEKIKDLFSEYKLSEHSADIYINTLQSSMYNTSCVASEEGFVYEMGHYVSDYLFNSYGHDRIKKEFDKLNEGCTYGTWEDGYENVFVNKHASLSFEDEVVDLIWYNEIHPNIIRTIDKDNYTVIHKKVEVLAHALDESLKSVTADSKMWLEALPQKPDSWALDTIQAMKEAALIPEEFDGMYGSYVTREDFYVLTLNVIEKKLGREEFVKTFSLISDEGNVAIDPVKGEIFVNSCADVVNIDFNVSDSKEKKLYEAYQIGLIDADGLSDLNKYITRLEIAKIFNYLGNELGVDISDYKSVNYDDISSVSKSEKNIIYFASNKGLLKGYGTSFKPHNYCTYQEAYLILMRFYSLI